MLSINSFLFSSLCYFCSVSHITEQPHQLYQAPYVQGADAVCSRSLKKTHIPPPRKSSIPYIYQSNVSVKTLWLRIKRLSLTFIGASMLLWMCALDISSKTWLVCKRLSNPTKRQKIRKILNEAVLSSWTGFFLFLHNIQIHTHTQTQKWHLSTDFPGSRLDYSTSGGVLLRLCPRVRWARLDQLRSSKAPSLSAAERNRLWCWDRSLADINVSLLSQHPLT